MVTLDGFSVVSELDLANYTQTAKPTAAASATGPGAGTATRIQTVPASPQLPTATSPLASAESPATRFRLQHIPLFQIPGMTVVANQKMSGPPLRPLDTDVVSALSSDRSDLILFSFFFVFE